MVTRLGSGGRAAGSDPHERPARIRPGRGFRRDGRGCSSAPRAVEPARSGLTGQALFAATSAVGGAPPLAKMCPTALKFTGSVWHVPHEVARLICVVILAVNSLLGPA